MKIRLFTIIGNGNAGKSTVARFLVMPTNYGGKRIKEWNSVTLKTGGYLKIFTRLRSFQEADMSVNEAVKFLKTKLSYVSKKLANPAYKGEPGFPVTAIKAQQLNVLATLRLDEYQPSRRMHPPAYDYLNAFIASGWDIDKIAILPTVDESAADQYDNFLCKASEYERYGVPVSYGDPWDRQYDALNWKIGKVRNLFEWG